MPDADKKEAQRYPPPGFLRSTAPYVRYVFAFALGIRRRTCVLVAVDLTVETEASKPLLDLANVMKEMFVYLFILCYREKKMKDLRPTGTLWRVILFLSLLEYLLTFIHSSLNHLRV